jgi:hypothetical protein
MPSVALHRSSPEDVAQRLADEHDSDWLDRFAHALDRALQRDQLRHIIATWGFSTAELGRLFGVSRQAIGGWLERGVPGDRSPAIADIAAVTDLLTRHLIRERIPAVVRRPAARLGEQSMVDFVAAGKTAELLEYTREMFDVGRYQR